MTGREIYRKPRQRSIRWGAFAESCAHRAVANGRVYLRAVTALARARDIAGRRGAP